MPRRLPVRPAKVFGNFFVLIVLSMISFIYYTYVFIVWGPRADSKSTFFNRLISQIFRRQSGAGAANILSCHIHNASLVILLSDDDRPRPSACILGLPSGRQREQAKEILFNVQRLQTREMPSLLCLQQVRPQHGPSLPLDQ